MRDNSPVLIVCVLLFLGLAGLLVLSNGANDRRLDASVIGINGLATWLAEGEFDVKKSHPRLSPHIRDLALRILPLYDMDMDRDASPARTIRDTFYNDSPRDIWLENYTTKTDELPTLVILPKWVVGIATSKVAHETGLVPLGRYPTLLRQMGLGGMRITRGNATFERNAMGANGNAALFWAQTFSAASIPSECKPMVKFGAGVLVIECQMPDKSTPTYVLSDPDLLNNHGLAVGDNAVAARLLIAQIVQGDTRTIYVDTSPDLLTAYDEDADERRDYTRSASDFARFFDPPFAALWAMLLVVLGVLYWRGAVRFGPIATNEDTVAEASKTAAIEIKARLLRLSNNDGRMVSDFVRGQINDLATQTFGTSLGTTASARFFALLARRDPMHGPAFKHSAETLMANAQNMSRPELYAALETYRTHLERIANADDSDRISKTDR